MAEVEYASADGLAGTVRPAGLISPGGRAFAFNCGAVGGMADALGRVGAIRHDDGGSPGDTFAEYAYLGIGRIVQEDYPEPEVRLAYDSGTPAREEDWSLDMTGNWPGFVQKTSGTTDLDQGPHAQPGQRDHRHHGRDRHGLGRSGA